MLLCKSGYKTLPFTDLIIGINIFQAITEDLTVQINLGWKGSKGKIQQIHISTIIPTTTMLILQYSKDLLSSLLYIDLMQTGWHTYISTIEWLTIYMYRKMRCDNFKKRNSKSDR